jgi:hypothetical protein
MMLEVHEALGVTLKGFGGILRCDKCTSSEPVPEAETIKGYLADGWPQCCGQTMT